MFATLKNTQQGDALETITTPFFKRREGKLAKVACTTCRSSKLKCSGDTNGCVRCRAKKIKCVYPPVSVARGSGHKKVASAFPSPSPSPSVGNAAGIGQSTAPADRFAEHAGPSTESSLGTTAGGHDDFSSELDFDIDMSAYLSLESGPELDQHQNSTFEDPYPSMWDEMIEQDTVAPHVSGTAAKSVQSTSTGAETGCACFSRAIDTHEAIEVAIWCQNQPRHDVNDTLQQQKRCLTDCEELLECQGCRTIPAFLMLMLSICVKIITSMDHMSCPESGSGRNTQKSSTTSSPHGPLEGWSPDRALSRFSSSVALSRWQHLDDDDEIVVMHSLLRVRVSRLERLLATVDKVVSAQSLPAHKARLQDIWQRLGDGPFKRKPFWDS